MIFAESGLLNVIQYVAIGIGAVNILLLFGLLYIYWTSYRKIKSEFTIGLLYFTLVLLLQNVLATGVLIMFFLLFLLNLDPALPLASHKGRHIRANIRVSTYV